MKIQFMYKKFSEWIREKRKCVWVSVAATARNLEDGGAWKYGIQQRYCVRPLESVRDPPTRKLQEAKDWGQLT